MMKEMTAGLNNMTTKINEYKASQSVNNIMSKQFPHERIN